MSVQTILSDWLRHDCPQMHAARISAFTQTVATAAQHRVLNLTALGRNRDSLAKEKHSIKQVDRLLGNPHLHNERVDLYRCMAHFIIGHRAQVALMLDWSIVPNGDYMLRAAMSYHGRTLTIFEAVYPQKVMEHAVTLTAFFSAIALVLPASCTPIFVMDAGFHNHWLNAIQQRGWHWIVRVRGNTHCRLNGAPQWSHCKAFHPSASAKPQTLGDAQLAKTNPLDGRLVLYKKPRMRGKDDRKDSATERASGVIKARQSALEPWLLATSLRDDYTANDIVNAYRQRMHIEESFRDTKARNGWRLEEMRSRTIERIQILLLIAAYALLILSVLGRYAEQQQYAAQFQANTTRSKRVLSLPRLGHCLLRRKLPLPKLRLGRGATLDGLAWC